jgi:hypothetical protein
MIGLLSVGFEFRNSPYSFLARVKEKENFTEYHITVMNGELEKLLYGNHILISINGEMQIDSSFKDDEQSKLKLQIARALGRYLDSRKLTTV